MIEYKNILILTKTLWSEPPRIRHQLSRLLYSKGHNVIFFEKSSMGQFKTKSYEKEGIKLIRYFELLHHQLRPFKFFVYLNNLISKFFIRRNIKNEDIDLIVNFNYDYAFLKDIFPDKKVITIINDDFVAQSKPWMTNSISIQLKNTCKNSDIVFTIHPKQYRELQLLNKHTYMLLPWAGNKYIEPINNKVIDRDTVLFWGFIDQRVDWALIIKLLNNNIKIRFIGHVLTRVKHKVIECHKYTNFELCDPMPIDEVVFTDVCCSIIPYNTKVEGVKAISVSNRTFQLLSYGIPIVHTSLPDLIEAPTSVIKKCIKDTDFIDSIRYFKDNFNLSQNEIEVFLRKHYSENRYSYLLSKLKEL